MNGSVKKDNKTGKYYYIVDIGTDQLTGKRKQKKRRGFNSKKEAEVALSQLTIDIKEDTYIAIDNVTLGEFIKEWLVEMKYNVAPSTYQNYVSFLKCHINPRMGNFRIQKIVSLTIQKFINELVEDTLLYPNTIKKIMDTLKMVFKKAVNLKLIKENPTLIVSLPKRVNLEMSVWDTNEIDAFLKQSKNHRFYTVFLIAILTGMRKGEILGLPGKILILNKKSFTSDGFIILMENNSR